MKTLLLLILVFSSFSAVADQRLSLESVSNVIEKLEKALPLIKEDAIKGEAFLKRLGDLYSERGRLKGILELEKPCKNCMDSKSDREKAIATYQRFLTQTRSVRDKQDVVFKLAHLYRLTGFDKKAEMLFLNIINGKRLTDALLIAEARSGLVEIYYARGQFKKALDQADRALKIKGLSRRSIVMYRKAWCLLNTGKTLVAQQTLIELLKNPELLMIQTTKGPKIDSGFQQEIAHDLALFFARGTVGDFQIQTLLELSPSDQTFNNLFYLGQELARVGSATAAVRVWDILLTSAEVTKNQRLEVQIRKAQLQLNNQNKKGAANALTDVAKSWNSEGCEDKVDCETLRILFKNIVISWSREVGSKGDNYLLQGFQAYTSVFKDDVDMIMNSARMASKMGHHKSALTEYRRASDISVKNKLSSSILESALLGEIEEAEATKELQLKKAAYENYLEKNDKGSRVVLVRYQLAQLARDTGNHKDAAERFNIVARMDIPSYITLRSKAADLAIDSLAILKDHKTIEGWSEDYAKLFPKRSAEYRGHARVAKLSQVSQALSQSGNIDTSLVLAKTSGISLAAASTNERVQIHKARIQAYEAKKDIDNMINEARQLYSIKGLSEKDNDYALAVLVWGHELKLEFAAAYSYAQKRKFSGLSKAQKALWLALMSEMAGQNSAGHYQEFIKATNSRQQANAVRAKFVRDARNPWSELEKVKNEMRSTPQLFGELSLYSFAKTKDYPKAEKILKESKVRYSNSGLRIKRHITMKEFNSVRAKISKHKILGHSQFLLKKSINTRMGLMASLEKAANHSLSSNDWINQLIAIEVLKTENQRLVAELQKIRAPRGLKKKDQLLFTAALEQKTKPFYTTIQKLEAKAKGFWNNRQLFKTLESDYVYSSQPVRGLIKRELKELKAVAQGSDKSMIQDIINEKSASPKLSDVKASWIEVKKDPFDLESIEELKALEEKRDSFSAVAYLDIRKTKIKNGVKP